MTAYRRSLVLAILGLCAALIATSRSGSAQAGARARLDTSMFAPSSDCTACHNNLSGPRGEDVSIAAAWRGSIMANAARDPYVHASVRRETLDHPTHAPVIEDECATCHLPASRHVAHAAGAAGTVFEHLSAAPASAIGELGRDGVTCTVCHQIAADRLGTTSSFNGGFTIAPANASGRRRAFGPLSPDAGRRRIMHSATGFEQEQAAHVSESELCATCHTLITEAIGRDGNVIGSLPEQMNYQEWRHSAFFEERRSCQSCHMPRVQGPVRVASVLGNYRDSLARHTFLGGNAFMLRMLNRYRDELRVEAQSSELESAERATVAQLERDTATLEIARASEDAGGLAIDVVVRNLAGHKFPTGYPSRRAWLHVIVRDRHGRAMFESGRIAPSGAIEGNDSDADGRAFEPHYRQITNADQVQIYESIMGMPDGSPTTGLLQATQYLKDNRLLPRGFDKRTADRQIAVLGHAAADDDFAGGIDRVEYRIATAGAASVDVELRYQSIGFRWARNLDAYDAREPRAFLRYYDSLASESSVVIRRATSVISPAR